MDVTKDHANRHSENDFAEQFLRLVDSGAGVIHVRAQEPIRAILAVRRTALLDKGIYKEWDVVNGFREFTIENYTDEGKTGDDNIDIGAAFSAPLGLMRDGGQDRTVFFVYANAHAFMENNPHMHQLLLMYNDFLPECKVCVVLVTPDMPLPESAATNSILTMHFHTPGLTELRGSLDSILDAASDDFTEGTVTDEEEKNKICYVGAGMSLLQFETYVSLAAVKAAHNKEDALTSTHITEEVQLGKTEIVNSSDILELYPSTSIGDVGGMENLKEWVTRRSRCYSDDAVEFGIEPPKGIVLVGPPGTGKSLVAKAISGVLGVPLVRLDFGRVFNSLVGASEQRIRSALRQVEAMSPCVLFCDEIDKGLGGIAGGSGGDSGVSMRVLGSFLTWLQDSTYPVFTMVTANNIDGLPPELLRRGRFDAIFSTSLPNPAERKEVLAIHLAKRGRKLKDYDEDEVDDVIAACDKYVPAEIESAVKDALVNAFSDDEDLAMSHVKEALAVMVPLSKAFEQQITRMNEWAKNNATPVSATVDQKRAARTAAANKSRISKRRRV